MENKLKWIDRITRNWILIISGCAFLILLNLSVTYNVYGVKILTYLSISEVFIVYFEGYLKNLNIWVLFMGLSGVVFFINQEGLNGKIAEKVFGIKEIPTLQFFFVLFFLLTDVTHQISLDGTLSKLKIY